MAEIRLFDSSISGFNALGDNGAGEGCWGWANIARSPRVEVDTAGTIQIVVEFGGSNSSGFVKQKEYKLSSHSIAAYVQTTYSNIDIEEIYKNVYGTDIIESNINWRLRCDYYNRDGQKVDSAFYPEVESGTSYENKYRALPGASTSVDVFNQFANSDISGSKTGNIGKQIRVRHYRDDSVLSVEVVTSYKSPNATTWTSIGNTFSETREDSYYCHTDITLAEIPPAGSKVKIEICHKNNNIKKYSTDVVTETSGPNLVGTTLNLNGFETLNAFDAYDEQMDIINPYLSGTIFDGYNTLSDFYTAFELKDVKFCFYYGSAPEGTSGFVIDTQGAQLGGVNGLIFNAKKKDFIDWANDLTHIRQCFNPFAGQYTVRCFVRFISVYDDIVYNSHAGNNSGKKSFTINFDKDPVVAWTLQRKNIIANTWSDVTPKDTEHGIDGDPIQENATYRIVINETYWTEGEYISTISPAIFNVTSNSSTPPLNTSTSGRTRLSTMSLSTAKELNDFDVLLTLTTSYSSSSTAVSQTYTTFKQTTPKVILQSCTVNSNYEINYSANVSTYGTGEYAYIKYCFCDGDNNELTSYVTVTDHSEPATLSGTIGCTTTGWKSKNVYLKLVTNIPTEYADNTKTGKSNYITIHAATPTVAYRENRIGINTSTVDSESIIDIHQIDPNATVIRIECETSGGNPRKIYWTFDLPNGQIRFQDINGDRHLLDLTTFPAPPSNI